jgi:signal peptidase I
MDRKLFINGVAQKEPYVYYDENSPYHAPDEYRDDFPAFSPFGRATPEWAASIHKYIQGEDLVVPPGHYFAMGDNRDVSYDSRFGSPALYCLVAESNSRRLRAQIDS